MKKILLSGVVVTAFVAFVALCMWESRMSLEYRSALQAAFTSFDVDGENANLDKFITDASTAVRSARTLKDHESAKAIVRLIADIDEFSRKDREWATAAAVYESRTQHDFTRSPELKKLADDQAVRTKVIRSEINALRVEVGMPPLRREFIDDHAN